MICKKKQDKKREFFIPSVEQAFWSNCFSERKKERGKCIKIGIKWWFGGAWKFAQQLLYDNDLVIYADGDISGFDKAVKDWQLYAYMASYIRYVNLAKMNRAQRRFFF